jgi:hypothetical protein
VSHLLVRVDGDAGGVRVARRITPAQARARLRQAQSKARQADAKLKKAVNDYSAGVRKVNRAIEDYNRKARAHNARVRANQDRLHRELARLQSSPPRSTRAMTYRRSVVTFQQSFQRLEGSGAETRLRAGLFDLSEGEAANSVAALNALLAEPEGDEATDSDVAELQATAIGVELVQADPDLDKRWRGALFALHPKNPDAARHFCTSAREMLSRLLEVAAPDDVVIATDPACARTPQGTVTRRARIRHCLALRGAPDATFEEFIEADIDNVIDLFGEFNVGTHGSAGRLGVTQLAALMNRVEDAIRFIHRITHA